MAVPGPATRVGSQVHRILWVQVAEPGLLIIISSSGVAVDRYETGVPSSPGLIPLAIIGGVSNLRMLLIWQ